MAELAPLAPKQPEGFTPSDYSVAVEPSRKRVTVVFNGEVVADSRRALVLKETRLPPVYYLPRSEEHTSELQSLMRISYAVFCLKKKKKKQNKENNYLITTPKPLPHT